MNHESRDNAYISGILNSVKMIAIVDEDGAISLPG